MKKSVMFALSLSLFAGLYSCGDSSNSNGQGAINSKGDSTSLAVGVLLGSNLQQMGFNTNDFKSSEFIKGFEAAAKGSPTMPDTAAQRIFQTAAMAIQMKSQNPTAPAPVIDPKLAEAFGTMAGPGIAQNGLTAADIDMGSIQQGFESVLSGKPIVDLQNAQRIFTSNPKVQAKQQEMQAKMQAEQANAEKAGVEFLTANKAKKGVMVTASGLQYEVMKAGKGKKPSVSNTVKVHYHGTLIDGTVFDSSVDRGEPIEFPLGNVIRGWQEGVALMPEGAKYKLYIPHQLGYGGQPSGKIPPFSTLVFEVELLAIVK